ncbi:MAG TPA: UDP-N-acetylmuramoyl-tripeptide--D-alanyl-D-alanine ligase [Patescibacteria group bacterium]
MLTFALYLLLIISSFKKILFWTNLWQTKEYRLDRLWIHFKETYQGRSLLFSNVTIAGILLFASYMLVILYDFLTPFFQLFVVSFFLFYICDFAKQIIDKKAKRPKLTFKSGVIVMLSLLFVTLLFFFPLTDKYLWMLIILGIISLNVSIWVFIFSFPSEIYTDLIAQKARNKMKKLKNIKVIAVSGSYGKSSTKEAIFSILSQKYNVVKTPLSNNTTIGISKTILKKVNENTDLFVVEMGAYKIGEIAQLCMIVRPDISITTAISDQHISLYGSFSNVIQSEKELIDSLSKKGLALFNGNCEEAKILFEKTKQKKLLYKVLSKYVNSNSNSITATNLTFSKNGCEFTVIFKNNKYKFQSDLLGEHVVENLLPGIFLGLHFNLSENEIQKGIKKLKPLPHTMEKVILKNGAIAIDDTFNASPESVISASKFMKYFNKKTYFVLTPLIELGKNAHARHVEVGKSLKNVDYVFVTNKNYFNDIKRGIGEKSKAKLIYGSYEEIANMIEKFSEKGDCIIFEGKESYVVLKHLL